MTPVISREPDLPPVWGFPDPGHGRIYLAVISLVQIIETSIYNLKEDAARSLVWVGNFDIVDPHGIRGTVENYISRIIKKLEREELLGRP